MRFLRWGLGTLAFAISAAVAATIWSIERAIRDAFHDETFAG